MVHFNVGNDAPPIKTMTEEQSDAHIVGVIFAQHFSLNKGLELFGEKADAAVHKELTQIHKMDTYEPVHKSNLTFEDKKKSLALLMFITEKRNGDIKARKVADGSNQHTYDCYDKSDGSSPTVATDSIFLTGVIDAKEQRAIAILDISNAFLHAENDEKVIMLLRGRLAEMMVQVDPSMYLKYVTYSSNGQAMLYVRPSKALYGMLRAALLFYKRLRSDLENMDFEIKPYDLCVANKMVSGHQMTICWHVDDLKVSHKKKDAVTALALKLASLYGPNL